MCSDAANPWSVSRYASYSRSYAVVGHTIASAQRLASLPGHFGCFSALGAALGEPTAATYRRGCPPRAPSPGRPRRWPHISAPSPGTNVPATVGVRAGCRHLAETRWRRCAAIGGDAGWPRPTPARVPRLAKSLAKREKLRRATQQLDTVLAARGFPRPPCSVRRWARNARRSAGPRAAGFVLPCVRHQRAKWVRPVRYSAMGLGKQPSARLARKKPVSRCASFSVSGSIAPSPSGAWVWTWDRKATPDAEPLGLW